MMEHGVKIEMDDFGTGYSNIDSVMHMPLSTVKLDRNLVVSAVENPRSATMTGYLIRVFHELGYEVLAEGVETIEQDQFVRAEGVDLIQGFYYSPAAGRNTACRVSGPFPGSTAFRCLTDAV